MRISSTTSSNVQPGRVALNDTIFVRFDVSEELQGEPAVTIGGHPAPVTHDCASGANCFVAKHVVKDGITNEDSDVEIMILVVDLSGNKGSGSSVTTFVVDLVPPVLEEISIVSGICDNGTRVTRSSDVVCGKKNQATAGVTVMFSFTASEELGMLPSVSVFGLKSEVINGSHNEYLAVYTVGNTDPEGLIPFKIQIADAVGNPGVDGIISTDGSSVIVDVTAPRLLKISLESSGQRPTSAAPGDVINYLLRQRRTLSLRQWNSSAPMLSQKKSLPVHITSDTTSRRPIRLALSSLMCTSPT